MLNLSKTVPYFLQKMIIALLFVTPFVVSIEIYNGLIVAKEFWFLGVVAFILLYVGIHLLFAKQTFKINLNLPDILLLVFYAWCFIRACFTPYTPVLYNHKLQMLTGGLVVYFFIKWALQNNTGIVGKDALSCPESFREPCVSAATYYILIISLLIAGLAQAIYGLLQLYGFYPSNHNLF